MIGELSLPPPRPRLDAGAAGLAPREPPGRAGGPAPPAAPPAPPTAELQEAKRLKRLLSDPEMQVSTHYHEPSGHVVMQIQSRTTGDVVDQIPSETLLRLFTALRESLIDETA
jgi:hypothetical protein